MVEGYYGDMHIYGLVLNQQFKMWGSTIQTMKLGNPKSSKTSESDTKSGRESIEGLSQNDYT